MSQRILSKGGVVIPRLSEDPVSPTEGAMWYNTTDKEARIFVNGVVSKILVDGDTPPEAEIPKRILDRIQSSFITSTLQLMSAEDFSESKNTIDYPASLSANDDKPYYEFSEIGDTMLSTNIIDEEALANQDNNLFLDDVQVSVYYKDGKVDPYRDYQILKQKDDRDTDVVYIAPSPGHLAPIAVDTHGDYIYLLCKSNPSGSVYINRYNKDMSIDSAFGTVTLPNLSPGIVSMKIQADGKILIGGNFFNYGGTTGRDGLVRLNSDGTLDEDFCENAVDGGKFKLDSGAMTSLINCVCLQPDGKILVGGRFADYDGTVGRNGLVRLNSDGTLDEDFCENAVDGGKFNVGGSPFSSPVLDNGIYVQSDGKILVGGQMFNYSGTTGRSGLIRLNSDGTLDEDFCENAVDGKGLTPVYSVFEQMDGKILVSGAFNTYGGVYGRRGLIRLNVDGTTDEPFCVNATDVEKFQSGRIVLQAVEDTTGQIYVSGGFENYNNTTSRSSLLALHNNGRLNVDFCETNVDGNKFYGISVNMIPKIAIMSSSDKYVLIVAPPGNSSASDPVIAINNQDTTSGSRNLTQPDFSPFGDYQDNTNSLLSGNIYDVKELLNGKVIVCGEFSSVDGVYNGMVCFNIDGTIDRTFCENAVLDKISNGEYVYRLAIQPDGKILAGGSFVNYGNVVGRNRLIRLNSDGTLDTEFCVNAADGNRFPETIRSIAVQPDGKILVGGWFKNHGGVSGRDHLVRLNSDGTLDEDFCENAVDGSKFNNVVFSLLHHSYLEPMGTIFIPTILVGGGFINYGGTMGRDYLVPLHLDGTVNTPFSEESTDGGKFNSAVEAMSISTSNGIIIGGHFTNYNTSGISRLVCLYQHGLYDHMFSHDAAGDESFSGPVFSITTNRRSGESIVVGNFTNYKSTSLSRCIVLHSSGYFDEYASTAISKGTEINAAVRASFIGRFGNYIAGEFTDFAGKIGDNKLIKLADYKDSSLYEISFDENGVLWEELNMIRNGDNGDIYTASASGAYYGDKRIQLRITPAYEDVAVVGYSVIYARKM